MKSLHKHKVRQVTIFQIFCMDFKLVPLLRGTGKEGWVQTRRVLMGKEAALYTGCSDTVE